MSASNFQTAINVGVGLVSCKGVTEIHGTNSCDDTNLCFG